MCPAEIEDIENPEELVELGLTAGLSGDLRKTIECFEKVIALQAVDHRIWFLLGLACDHTGRIEKGIEC